METESQLCSLHAYTRFRIVHPTTMRAGPVSESVDLLNDILVLSTGIAYIDDDLLALGDEAASDKTELTARRNVLLGALDHKKLSLLCMEAIS